MKIHRGLSCLLLLAPFLMSTTVLADGGWWERSKRLLQGLEQSDGGTTLSRAEIASGLREALRVGSSNVVDHLGRENGYYNDPRAHIPLPDSLEKVRSTLARVGLDGQLDDLEQRLNRAAEAAVPRARAMFVTAIENMTLDDVREIYQGPEDAATRYFQQQMSAPLKREFSPVVNDSLAEAGAVRVYDNVMRDYEKLPFVPDLKADLSAHVVDHAIGAVFDYLALEEAAIRENPARRTTELLQRVFGS